MNASTGNFRHIGYACKTDVGKRRKNNEDALGAFPEAGIFCVADGMGGGDDGEIASAAVVKAVGDVAARCADGKGHTAKAMAEALERGLCEASKWIFGRASAKKMGVCGSTFAGVVFDSAVPGRAMAVHAGDSRVYLIHSRRIKQITRDHSAAEMMGEKDESKMNPMFRSMIVNAVGIRDRVECEFTSFKVSGGDYVLMCSDGLYRMVEDRRIVEILRECVDVGRSVAKLIEEALAAGGVDNVSVVLCEIGKLPKGLPAEPIPEKSPDEEDECGNDDSATLSGDSEQSTWVEGGTCDTVLPTMHTVATAASPEQEEAAPSKKVSGRTAWAKSQRRAVFLASGAVLAAVMAVAAIVISRSKSEGPVQRPPQVMAPPEIPRQVQMEKPEPEAAAVEPAVATPEEKPEPDAAPEEKPDVAPGAPAPEDVVAPAQAPAPAAGDDDAAGVAVESAPIAVVDVVEEVKEAALAPDPLPELKEASEPEPPGEPAGPCEELVRACESKAVNDFAAALKKAYRQDDARDLVEQLNTFKDSARGAARMRSEKYLRVAVVDLKYVLLSVELDDVMIDPATDPGDEKRFREDWELVKAGSEDDLEVQKACARVVLAAPKMFK